MCYLFLKIFFGFYFLLDFLVECVHGCEGFTHPWEGREALGEGLSWAQHCSQESYLMMKDLFYFMEYGLH